jgi:hypothetical protein
MHRVRQEEAFEAIARTRDSRFQDQLLKSQNRSLRGRLVSHRMHQRDTFAFVLAKAPHRCVDFR